MTREQSTASKTTEYTGLEIAVIGMAGRFPGAKHIREFWDNLLAARETITFFSNQELEKRGFDPGYIEDSHFVKAKPVLEDKDCFDASFFGYTPREAEVIAPHIRVFFESAWGALEDAGYDPGAGEGVIGCYAGSGSSFEWQLFSLVTGKARELGEETAALLNNKDGLSTWLAYKLDLKGPCFTCYTACSTSLLAIHLASRALLTGECDMALAGGVSILVSDKPGYLHQEGIVSSADGHCRSFDARASGTIFGEGVGVVVLKRLSDAMKKNDHIYAVVKGSAANNDGIDRVGYTAPGTLGQREVIKRAHRAARVQPESIGYVETHGTATIIGDPIEIEALKQAFQTGKRHFCALGSVKANVGHLDAAAGVTGFIKTVLALKHRQLPPSLHFESPNPQIDFENSPFYVNTRLTRWESDDNPLRAGVSAFGIGGTNVHVVLEEWPGSHSSNAWRMEHGAEPERKEHDAWRQGSQGRVGVSPPSPSRQYQLILLSAKTETALEKMTQNLVNFLKENRVKPGQNPGIDLADVAYTLQVGRRVFSRRRMLVCSTLEEAITALSNTAAGKTSTFYCKEENQEPTVIFMFSGLGAQYINMGRDLYEKEPLFQAEMNRCFKILDHLSDYKIKEILYPHEPGNNQKFSGGSRGAVFQKSPPGRRRQDINQPAISQAAIFIFEYALAKLLIHWGIRPRAMIGYSFGEYAAACVAGVFSPEHALELVVTRAKLIERTPEGAMLSVPLTKEQLMPLLTPRLSLAIDNGISCLVAGHKDAIDAFEQQMKAGKCICMRLPFAAAVHSVTMEPILEKFHEKVKEIKFTPPAIPYISNVTGEEICPDEVVKPGYWSAHLRQTVRFAEGIEQLVKMDKNTLFLEIGPGHDISSLVLRYTEKNPGQQVINLVRHPQKEISDIDYLLNKIGRMWLYGKRPNWHVFSSPEKRQRVSLPLYPFDTENNRYPAEGDPFAIGRELFTQQHLLTKKPDISDWFYQPSWKRLSLVSQGDKEENKSADKSHWLVFITDSPDTPLLCTQIIKKLKQRHDDKHRPIITTITTVGMDTKFKKVNEGSYKINPGHPGDYFALVDELRSRQSIPRKILHLWNVTGENSSSGVFDPGAMHLEKAQEKGFYSLLYLVKAIGKQDLQEGCEISVVTNNMQEVAAEKWLNPGKKTVLAAVNVIPQEYPMIRCRSIDIVVPPAGSEEEKRLPDQLIAEVNRDITDTIVAFRGNHRWVRTYEPLRLEDNGPGSFPLKKQGVYFITGGLGSVGMILVESLFKRVGAKLVLTGRTPLPPQEEWSQWLEKHAGEPRDRINQKLRKLQELKNQGAEVLVLNADAADETQMQSAIARAEEQFGQINGVIHAAGVVGGPSMQLMADADKTMCQQQFRPKIHGLMVLEKVLTGKPLDFCMLMSSISSVLGGLGFAAYSAANLFMDAFVINHNRAHPRQPWISVNWDGWPQQGPGNEQAPTTGIGAELVRLTMTAEEAFETFNRILTQKQLRQVVVSTGHLQTRIDRWIKLETVKEGEKESQQETTPARARPSHLMSAYTAPRGPIEKTMVEILQHMLGFEQIGIDDDFFELGIDSIKIIQIRARLNKKGYTVEMGDFFLHPTISQLAPLARKLETVEAKEKKKSTPGHLTSSGLTREAVDRLKKQYSSPIEDIYTLTPMQEGMLFYSLYERKNTSTFFEQFSYRLHGDLDASLVERSVNELIKRHDVLRTAFIHKDLEQPLQVVLKERPVEFYYEDLRRLAGKNENDYQQRNEWMEEYRLRDRQRPFDLSKDVLMRIAFFRLGDDDYSLLWSFHHILMDGWCTGVLHWEFFTIYYSLLINRPYQLPPVQPYSTYIRWLEARGKNETRRYWRKFLHGYDRIASIPKRDRGILEKGFRDAAVSAFMAKEDSEQLKQLAARNHVTLNTVIQAIWAIVLGRYTGKQDVVFGVVVSGRPSEIQGVESMIGCFVNTIPIRIIYNENTSFNDLLQAVRQKAIESEPHHYCSLAEIQAESPLKQNLLDHVIDFQNFPIAAQIEGALERAAPSKAEEKERKPGDEKIHREQSFQLSNIQAYEQSNYDLNVVVVPGEQLSLTIAYNANAYDRELIQALGTHSLRVLNQVMDNDTITIKEITFLSQEEKNRLLENLRDQREPGQIKAADINHEKTKEITADFDF